MIRRFTTALQSTAVVVGLNVAFLVTLFYLGINSAYEDRLSDAIVKHVTRAATTQQDSVLALLHATHGFVRARSELLGGVNDPDEGLKEKLFPSADLRLLSGDACGSYALVLARLVQSAGLGVRVAQMKCGDAWGCHIFVEANVKGKWVALDPTFDLAFMTPAGDLASVAEIRADWAHFRQQLPADYVPRYAYEDVRYTNWSKVPGALPLIRSVLRAAGVQSVDTISLRTHFLNVYKAYLQILVIPYLLVLALTLRTARRLRMRSVTRAMGSRAAPDSARPSRSNGRVDLDSDTPDLGSELANEDDRAVEPQSPARLPK
jgi:hypothetical protein